MFLKRLKRKFRYNKKRRYLVTSIILLLCFLGLGYAALATDLSIVGISKFSGASWDVHFANIQVKSGSVTPTTAPTISNNTTVSFAATLEDPGDFYEFNIDVVNSGSMDAMIDSVRILPVLTSEEKVYFDYIVTYSDGVELGEKHKLDAGDTENLRVAFIYKTLQDTTEYPDMDQDFNISVQINYVQKDGTAIDKPDPPTPFIMPLGRTMNNLQVGDEICLEGTTECFNFIRYDGDDIVLLAKYNLKVGRNFDDYNSTYSAQYTSSDTGYGLQDSTMRGYVEDSDIWNGVVGFSYTNYWKDGSALKAKYGSSYPAYVYDTDYVIEPDFSTTCDNSTNCWKTSGYSIAYYVNQYKNKLTGTGYGANIKDARLLTYAEATDSSIGCSGSNCPTTGFITNTTFWLGSANGNYSVWNVTSGGSFDYSNFNYGDFIGVRPVIIVEKKEANFKETPIPVQLPAGRTKDNLQVGDEIIISGETDEYFNFVRYDGDDIVLLAKYNLKVGQINDSSWNKTGDYTSNDTGYGLQSSDARGYVEDATSYNGTVVFSYTNYWNDNGTPKSKYPGAYYPGPNYPTVYDTDYITAPDFSTTCGSTNCFKTEGYSIAYYVEQYKNTLMGTGYGAPIKEARLLTYEEATDSSIGCDGSNGTCPTTGFITNTSFWLGSASDGNFVWYVYSFGGFDYSWSSADFGVRPVITISKSNL